MQLFYLRYFHDILLVRMYLNLYVSTALANALVSSKPDYCMSLPHSISRLYLYNCNSLQILWPAFSLSLLDLPAVNNCWTRIISY